MPEPLRHAPSPPSSDQLIYDDGEPLESARHRQQMSLLIESLELAWRDRTDFYVGGNMFLYFSETQSRRNDFRGPDVFVVLNTSRRERRAWVVWEENGQTPDVVIELLSEQTEHVDRGEKMRVYARSLKIGEYFLFDPFSGVLEGYELDVLRARYVSKLPGNDGRLRCEQLNLYLGKVRSTLHAVDAEWLRWQDESGSVLELPVERADAERQRADAERQRADAERQRADQLEAELAALKVR